ncbi:MAG: hypothetical protein ACXQT0_00230 [Candidatus Methanofastidiosia archaeon]
MNGTSTVTDVRIIVEGLQDAVRICEALDNSFLGNDYGASITSIIPTTDVAIAKNAASGADVIIIATDTDESGLQLGSQIDIALDEICDIAEKIHLPNGQSVEFTDSSIIKDALEKALVRAGLKSLRMFANKTNANEEVIERENIDEEIVLEHCLDKSSESDDNEDLLLEINNLELENKKCMVHIDELEKKVNEIMIDSYGRYDIREVWESLFDADMPDTEEMALAASRLADNVFVSGNFIFAQSLKNVETFLDEFKEMFL